MSEVIYFDHAATSWPKPAMVRESLDRYFDGAGGNPGRSGHRMSIAAAQAVEETRDLLAALLGAPDPGRIAFTKNASEALNIAIHGLVGAGDHVVTTSIEHNSVMRPLRHLESRGARVTVVPCGPDGMLDGEQIDDAIRPDTTLVTTTHGSNVMGALLPIATIARVCRDRGVPYLVDASQTAGAIPLNLEALGVDLLAFTGHKALLGLTGTGGLWVRPGLSVDSLLQGGTGSRSDEEWQPDFMPDAHEAGTLNLAGIIGLGAGVRHLLEVGVASVEGHERTLTARFVDRARATAGVTVFAPADPDLRCGVVSFNVDGLSPSEVGTILDRDFGIMSRVGLHCAPGAHRTIGTFPTGTVRFGFGVSNTIDQVDTALDALGEIARWSATEAIAHV